MKKLFLILLAGTLFSFSCENDDNDNSTEQNSIVGTWKIVSKIADGNDVLQEELAEDGICHYNYVFTQTTINNIVFSGTDCATETSGNADVLLTYTINENILSIVADGIPEEVELEILELTSTTLKLQESIEEDNQSWVQVETFTRVE